MLDLCFSPTCKTSIRRLHGLPVADLRSAHVWTGAEELALQHAERIVKPRYYNDFEEIHFQKSKNVLKITLKVNEIDEI